MTTTNCRTRWLVAVVALTLAITGSAWLQWHVRREPETAHLFVGPLLNVEIVAESNHGSREAVRDEFNRMVDLGYSFEVAAGGLGGRWFVMQRKGER